MYRNEAQCGLAYPIDESTINRLMVRPSPTAGGAATPLGNWNHEVGAQVTLATRQGGASQAFIDQHVLAYQQGTTRPTHSWRWLHA
ncbi:MAG: hypothetical protein R3E92_24375, partial [Burkholderiaceae bacterium]